jgi:hypothetical protein
MNKVINRAIAFSKGKKVMTTISITDAKKQSVEKYYKLYGKKAIYKKDGVKYVKPFIRVQAQTAMEV